METGQANPNVRKRRFTEDLSFLQNTAQTYNVKKSQSFVAPQNGGGDVKNVMVLLLLDKLIFFLFEYFIFDFEKKHLDNM